MEREVALDAVSLRVVDELPGWSRERLGNGEGDVPWPGLDIGSNSVLPAGSSSAWMLPADVTARIGPSIPFRKIGPAPLSQRTPLFAAATRMLPAEVAAVTSRATWPTLMLPPLVCTKTSPPADSIVTLPPPVSARTWPERGGSPRRLPTSGPRPRHRRLRGSRSARRDQTRRLLDAADVDVAARGLGAQRAADPVGPYAGRRGW